MPDNVSGDVDQLLRDREKYEAWLRKLEAEKAKVSDRAYARVREDYQSRLSEVDRRLQEHSHSIRSRLQEVERVLDDLEREKASRVEDLEEARLRHSVGEYQDEAEWQDLEGKLAGAVQKTEQRLDRAQQEIGKLREILEHVQVAEVGDGRSEAPQSATGDAGSAPSAEPSAQASSPGVKTENLETSATSGPNGSRRDAGELAALPDEEFGGAPPQPPTTSRIPEESDSTTRPEGEGVEDELAFLESLSLDESDEDLESLTFLEQRGRGQPQTVICPQCSAANDPAEWYCTECGEELPAE